jgi:hypothetical protein
MTTPIELQAIRARVARLEAQGVELLPRVAALTQAEKDRARLLDALDRIERELDHASMNEHYLDRDGQGVGPGEKIPAVRVSNIEAAIAGAMRGES